MNIELTGFSIEYTLLCHQTWQVKILNKCCFLSGKSSSGGMSVAMFDFRMVHSMIQKKMTTQNSRDTSNVSIGLQYPKFHPSISSHLLSFQAFH